MFVQLEKRIINALPLKESFRVSMITFGSVSLI